MVNFFNAVLLSVVIYWLVYDICAEENIKPYVKNVNVHNTKKIDSRIDNNLLRHDKSSTGSVVSYTSKNSQSVDETENKSYDPTDISTWDMKTLLQKLLQLMHILNFDEKDINNLQRQSSEFIPQDKEELGDGKPNRKSPEPQNLVASPSDSQLKNILDGFNNGMPSDLKVESSNHKSLLGNQGPQTMKRLENPITMPQSKLENTNYEGFGLDSPNKPLELLKEDLDTKISLAYGSEQNAPKTMLDSSPLEIENKDPLEKRYKKPVKMPQSKLEGTNYQGFGLHKVVPNKPFELPEENLDTKTYLDLGSEQNALKKLFNNSPLEKENTPQGLFNEVVTDQTVEPLMDKNYNPILPKIKIAGNQFVQPLIYDNPYPQQQTVTEDPIAKPQADAYGFTNSTKKEAMITNIGIPLKNKDHVNSTSQRNTSKQIDEPLTDQYKFTNYPSQKDNKNPNAHASTDNGMIKSFPQLPLQNVNKNPKSVPLTDKQIDADIYPQKVIGHSKLEPFNEDAIFKEFPHLPPQKVGENPEETSTDQLIYTPSETVAKDPNPKPLVNTTSTDFPSQKKNKNPENKPNADTTTTHLLTKPIYASPPAKGTEDSNVKPMIEESDECEEDSPAISPQNQNPIKETSAKSTKTSPNTKPLTKSTSTNFPSQKEGKDPENKPTVEESDECEDDSSAISPENKNSIKEPSAKSTKTSPNTKPLTESISTDFPSQKEGKDPENKPTADKPTNAGSSPAKGTENSNVKPMVDESYECADDSFATSPQKRDSVKETSAKSTKSSPNTKPSTKIISTDFPSQKVNKDPENKSTADKPIYAGSSPAKGTENPNNKPMVDESYECADDSSATSPQNKDSVKETSTKSSNSVPGGILNTKTIARATPKPNKGKSNPEDKEIRNPGPYPRANQENPDRQNPTCLLDKSCEMAPLQSRSALNHANIPDSKVLMDFNPSDENKSNVDESNSECESEEKMDNIKTNPEDDSSSSSSSSEECNDDSKSKSDRDMDEDLKKNSVQNNNLTPEQHHKIEDKLINQPGEKADTDDDCAEYKDTDEDCAEYKDTDEDSTDYEDTGEDCLDEDCTDYEDANESGTNYGDSSDEEEYASRSEEFVEASSSVEDDLSKSDSAEEENASTSEASVEEDLSKSDSDEEEDDSSCSDESVPETNSFEQETPKKDFHGNNDARGIKESNVPPSENQEQTKDDGNNLTTDSVQDESPFGVNSRDKPSDKGNKSKLVIPIEPSETDKHSQIDPIQDREDAKKSRPVKDFPDRTVIVTSASRPKYKEILETSPSTNDSKYDLQPTISTDPKSQGEEGKQDISNHSTMSGNNDLPPSEDSLFEPTTEAKTSEPGEQKFKYLLDYIYSLSNGSFFQSLKKDKN